MSKVKFWANIAVASSVGLVGIGIYSVNAVHKKLTAMEYYQKSLKLLSEHRGAMELMGGPLQEKQVNLWDRYNHMTTETAKMRIPVDGSKLKKCRLYLWADREEGLWNIRRLELEVPEVKDKRLVVYKT